VWLNLPGKLVKKQEIEVAVFINNCNIKVGYWILGCGRSPAESLQERKIMRDHTKLRAFELADELALAIYKMTSAFPKEEIYGITSQMRRAAVSVP